MSITLSDITYSQLALYCVYFALTCFAVLVIYLIFIMVSNTIEKLILSLFDIRLRRMGIYKPASRGRRKISKSTMEMLRIKVWKVRIKGVINWIEKIIIISIILFIMLVMIKLLIHNETFAYTIVTLFIFIISNQIASFIRTSWSTDRYILSPIIGVNELIEISDEIGIVHDIGKDFFWIKCEDEDFCKFVRIPISHLNFQKFAKITEDKRRNNRNNSGGTQIKNKKDTRNNFLTKRKKKDFDLYDFNMNTDLEINVLK